MNTPAGCPVFSMPPLWRWTSSNSILIAIVMIVLGYLLLQYGGKYFMASMCIIATFGMTCIILCVLYGLLMPSSTPQYMVWMSVFFSMGAGAGLGYGVYNWPKAGIISIGLVVGAFIGSLIYTIFLSQYTGNQSLLLDM